MVQGSEWHAHHPRYRRVAHCRPRDAWVASDPRMRPPFDDDTTKLAMAHRMVDGLQPFSPAWDAAMAWVDELEAALDDTGDASTGT
jgi:hypothetical protein